MKNPREPQRNDGIHCTPRAGICPSEKHIPIENLVVFGRPCRPDRCKTTYAHRGIVHTLVLYVKPPMHTVILYTPWSCTHRAIDVQFKANLVKQTLVVS